MRRVTGIGGIFFKARDPVTLREWYRQHLGIDVQEWGGTTFRWDPPGPAEPPGFPFVGTPCAVASLYA